MNEVRHVSRNNVPPKNDIMFKSLFGGKNNEIKSFKIKTKSIYA